MCVKLTLNPPKSIPGHGELLDVISGGHIVTVPRATVKVGSHHVQLPPLPEPAQSCLKTLKRKQLFSVLLKPEAKRSARQNQFYLLRRASPKAKVIDEVLLNRETI